MTTPDRITGSLLGRRSATAWERPWRAGWRSGSPAPTAASTTSCTRRPYGRTTPSKRWCWSRRSPAEARSTRRGSVGASWRCVGRALARSACTAELAAASEAPSMPSSGSGDPNTSGNADRAGNGAAMRIAPVAASMAEMPEDEFRQGVRHGRCGHGRQRDPRRLEANSLLRGSGRLGPDAGGSREPAQAPDLMEVEKRLCAIVRGSST